MKYSKIAVLVVISVFFAGAVFAENVMTQGDSFLTEEKALTVNGPPSAPVLNGAVTSGTSVRFSWSAVSNATDYVHYFAPVPDPGEGLDITETNVGMDPL